MSLFSCLAVLACGCENHVGQAAGSRLEPKGTDVCSLVENPSAFANVVVVVTADVETDVRHFVLLVDPRCPGRGVALRFPSEPPERKDLAALRDLIFGPAGRASRIRARFSGTFQWTPAETPSRTLLLESYDGLHVLSAETPTTEMKRSVLTVTFRTDKSSYEINDAIRFEVALVNLGELPIKVYGDLLWGPNAGFELHVARPDGTEVFTGSMDHDFVVPSTLQSREAYARLLPGQFLGTFRTVPLAQLVLEAGTYLVYVDYLSPAPGALIHVKDVWTRERGKMRTKPLTILVLPNASSTMDSPPVKH
jgi:hypothetical protein